MLAVKEEETTIAGRCWESFGKESAFALYSPLCVSLAAGILDPRSFADFLSHGVTVLKSFAHAYKLAEECADDDEEKNAIRQLREFVVQKLENRKTLVHKWGFELPETSSSDAPTLKYTNFLVATATGKLEGEFPGSIATPFERTKVAAYTLAVIAACMKMYACMSHVFKTLLDPSDRFHRYKEWIDYYTSQGFKVELQKTEDVLERLSVSFTGVELRLEEKLYKRALTLQLEFFAALKISPKTLVPLCPAPEVGNPKFTIFCDFDLTCTSIDSGATLAEMTIIKSRVHFPTSHLVQCSSEELRNIWNVISQKYSQGFELRIESITSGEPGKAFDYNGLSKALKQVSDFEKAANDLVEGSKVLRDISQGSIKLAGKGLVLQDGCRRFFQKIVMKEIPNIDVHIISYCWCSDLIRTAFSSDLNVSNIHSNELVYEDSLTTGAMVRKIESPEEKLQSFFEVVKNRRTDANHLAVYIGGDVGDLLCLLEADIGLVIGSSESIQSVGHHFGVKFVPLFRGLVQKQKEVAADSTNTWKPRSGILYTVSCWAEIEAFILGL